MEGERNDAYRGSVSEWNCRGGTAVSVKITCDAIRKHNLERCLCGHSGKTIDVEEAENKRNGEGGRGTK